jgi:putative ABC transport system permease protein
MVVALAIAVGVYAIGVVLNTRELVVREYRADQDGALMAAAVIHTAPFDEALAERIAELPGVSAAEGRSQVRVRVYDERDMPRDLVLTSISDFDEMTVDLVTMLDPAVDPGKGEVVLERQALDYLGVAIGDTVVVELDSGATKSLEVVGRVHDAQQLSPGITSRPTGYVSPATMGTLGLGEAFTQLHIRVSEHAGDEAHINSVVDEIEAHLRDTGRPVFRREVNTESIADPFIDTIVLILSSFGVIILVLSGFLVVNAISALISQQIPQIGVMKLIGARRSQIMGLYIATVLVYGLIAIVLGIPLAVVTSRFLMQTLVEGLLNVRPDSYSLPLVIIVAQAAVGLLLPLLAGLAPVIKGTRVTTQKALSAAGMENAAYGRGWVERLVGQLQRVTSMRRPILLALRNTLRHKGRLVQTLVVLIIGTALFVSVLSVRASVDATVDDFMRFHQYDVSVELDMPYRLSRLEQVSTQVPGVLAVEGWSLDGAVRQRPDGTESDGMQVYAVPAQTTFMNPRLLEGRWFGPDRNELVFNSDVVDREPDLGVGDEVTLEMGGRETVWQIVGIVPTESRGPAVYMKHEDYGYVTRTPDQVTHLQVFTGRHDAASQEEMEALLLARLEARGIGVSGTENTQVMREENELLFTIIVAFLILMALLLAAVGGLGLTTTMSINILERVREIGVLRAIGASNLSVRKVVLIEGVVIGVLSWTIGMLISLPVSSFMSEQLGIALINIPLLFQYSTGAAVLWFFVLQGVALVASLGPARNAVRLTIREVLAYE